MKYKRRNKNKENKKDKPLKDEKFPMTLKRKVLYSDGSGKTLVETITVENMKYLNLALSEGYTK